MSSGEKSGPIRIADIDVTNFVKKCDKTCDLQVE